MVKNVFSSHTSSPCYSIYNKISTAFLGSQLIVCHSLTHLPPELQNLEGNCFLSPVVLYPVSPHMYPNFKALKWESTRNVNIHRCSQSAVTNKQTPWVAHMYSQIWNISELEHIRSPARSISKDYKGVKNYIISRDQEKWPNNSPR